MKNLLFVVIGMFVCIVILLGVLLLNKKPNTKSVPTQSNSASQSQNNIAVLTTSPNHSTENCKQFPLAQGCGVVGSPINICSDQHPNYPPIAEILTTNKNPAIGVYKGKITNLDVHLHTITVTSDINRQPFTFNGGSVNGKIFDIHNTPAPDFHSLRTGSNAVVSFNCAQKNGYFVLNRFQLVH